VPSFIVVLLVDSVLNKQKTPRQATRGLRIGVVQADAPIQ